MANSEGKAEFTRATPGRATGPPFGRCPAALWGFSVRSATLIEKCCLIANPAAGNPTHYLVEQSFAQSGLDWRFMTFEVEPPQLGDAMRGIRALGFHGVK